MDLSNALSNSMLMEVMGVIKAHSMSNGNVAEPIDQFCSEEQMGMGMPWPTSLE